MRLLTMNCWHGLDGAGLWKMGELESRERRLARLAAQLEDFRQADFDLIFLQEVNPLFKRGPELASGLKMDWIGQGDLSGVKLFGCGPPLNLHSGLCILARPDLQLRRLRGVQLSGPWWGVSRGRWALQSGECRFALLAEVVVKALGRLLVVNAHLHHGIEPNPDLMRELQALAEEAVITPGEHSTIIAELERARARRIGEVQRLCHALSPYLPHYDGVVIAGDMNSNEDSPCLEVFAGHGMKDLTAGQGIVTWDPERNSYNFRHAYDFRLPVSDFGKRELLDLFRREVYSKRRLDTIFIGGGLPAAVRALALFGADKPVEQMTSDHFGLWAEL